MSETQKCHYCGEEFPYPAELHHSFSECINNQKEREKENRELRKFLWLNHGCKFGSLYGDDGEMQCGTPGHAAWDFRRGKVEDLFEVMTMYLRKLQSAVEVLRKHNGTLVEMAQVFDGHAAILHPMTDYDKEVRRKITEFEIAILDCSEEGKRGEK